VSDLATWLLEQIDADEQVARDAIADDCGQTEGLAGQYDWLTGRNARVNTPRFGDALARLTVTFAVPARVLAECEAKRRTVNLCARVVEDDEGHNYYSDGWAGLQVAVTTLRFLALTYSDRPGYRQEEWAP
jgi:hypothetical protein